MTQRIFCTLIALALSTQAYAEPPTSAPAKTVTKAVAKLHPTEGNKVEGTVTFTAVDGGVLIVADVTGLTPGKHGFHVHEHGDCSAGDASSAGGHYNPTNKKHGGPGTAERHVGDMGNLEADKDGKAHYERVDDLMTLNGPDTIVERSIIVHANEDDLTTQPTGNSGPKVACGVIEAE